MSLDAIATYAAGPASAVVVMLLFFGAMYQITTKHLIPLLKIGLERHLSALDALVTQQRQDHSRIIASLVRIEEHTAPIITDHGVKEPNGISTS